MKMYVYAVLKQGGKRCVRRSTDEELIIGHTYAGTIGTKHEVYEVKSLITVLDCD